MIKNLFFLFCLILISCKPSVKTPESGIEKEKFESVFAKNNIQVKDYKNIIIIPGSGCSGCISEAETYFKAHSKEKENLFVFTAIGDVKILKMKFKDSTIFGNNVFIDEKNELVDNGFDSIYPSTATLDPDSELVKISVFSK